MFDVGTDNRLRNINAQFHTTQVEADCRQAREQAEEREQELRKRISSAEEGRILAEDQVKDLKENIFELEDQVEQHRAVNCHTNQAVLDMESMFTLSPPQINTVSECFCHCCSLKPINIYLCRSRKDA